MDSIADGSIIVQALPQSLLSTPPWFGEVALIVQHLRKHELLSAITEHVRFVRRRFGQYEVIDFLAVLFGYTVSGERTLEAFYQRLSPFASAFMALFGHERLPARSTLSRFLAALPPEPVEALRTLFLSDLLARPPVREDEPTGLWDRTGNQWHVFDSDGTREAARQRALPKTPELPVPQRRLRPLCAPGYTERKRGEVVRSRTTILQAHSNFPLTYIGHIPRCAPASPQEKTGHDPPGHTDDSRSLDAARPSPNQRSAICEQKGQG